MNKIINTSRPTRKVFSHIYLLFFSFSLYAQLPNGFVDAKIQGGYTVPMGVIFSKDGQKMFVWEKKGKLWVSKWNGSTYVKQATVVLDISEEVGDWGDFGFESVALDPDFDSNGLIYTFYQVDRHHLLKFGTSQYSSTTNEYFNATISRLTRYQVNTNTLIADNSSRKVLLGETKSTGVPATHQSHAGGQILFGTDGTLFVSTGDNASFSGIDSGSKDDTYFQQAINDGIMRSTENVGSLRSQMINSFCGKLLRMDPNTGNGISSNPYYDSGNPRSAKSRVWALGLRNPYRMSFKTGTGSSNPSNGNPGTILIGDVQNATWEEVHIIEKGGFNCGWPLYEGITPVPAFQESGVRNQEESGSPTFASLCVQANKDNINNSNASQRRFSHFPPAIDWRHGQSIARYPDYSSGNLQAKTIGSAGAHVTGTPFAGSCVTSGTYYTGTAFPANYRNVYFFADYESNWIKAAVLHDNSDHQIHEVKDFAPAGYGKGIVDIEYCPLDGSIFYVNINTGEIQKISYGSGNRPPIAAISANKTSGTSPLSVNFSSSGSSDPDGNAIFYEWNFGDGASISTSANPSHTFTASSSKGFTVTLTVKDNQGLTDSKTMVISINNTAPSVKITNPTNNAKYVLTGPTQYALKATVTDNDASGMQYAWQVTLRHNSHEHKEPVVTQQSPTVQISPVGCDGEDYYYLISLTVTDKGGLTAQDEVKVFPDCNSQSLNVSNLIATAQNSAVDLKWTNTIIAFDEVMVVAKDGSGFSSSPSGTSYTANANFTSTGSSFEGGKVVYKGKGSTITVTGLSNGQKYYFRVYTRKSSTWTGGKETSATPAGLKTTKSADPSLFDPNKCYRLTARHSGKVMEIASRSTATGARAVQNVWNASKNQVWRIKSIDGTYYRITNGNSGKTLDVKAVSLLDGAYLQQYDNNNGLNQQFKFEASGSYYFISARHSGKYLDVSGSSTTSGTAIVQMPKKGTNNQQWTVSSETCPSGTVALIVAQIYTADGYRDGRKGIVTWVSNASDADYFTIEKLDKNGNFDILDQVNAKPVSDVSTKNYYSYTDNATFDGENIYRITLVTDNASPQYSNLITLDFKSAMDFMLFPNPTSDYIDIDLKPYIDRPVALTVVDASGREVRVSNIEKAGKIHRIELDGLTNGQYILRIHTSGKRDVARLFNITR